MPDAFSFDLRVIDVDGRFIVDPNIFVRVTNEVRTVTVQVAFDAAMVPLRFDDRPAGMVLQLRVTPSRYHDARIFCQVDGKGFITPPEIRVPRRSSEWLPEFGTWRDESPAVELDSVHHLEKSVDGVPLRRPPWFFDVRVQGSGVVDIPTHIVDQTQWLAEARGGAPDVAPELLDARAWPTRVPLDAFFRITGATTVPPTLASRVEGDALSYRCNAELRYRLGPVIVRASTRWDLAAPPGGGDTYRTVAHGTRADVGLEQGPHTAHRRRVFVRPHDGDVDVAGHVERLVAE